MQSSQQCKYFDRVIVTGFKVFGGHSMNPTEELVASLSEDDMKKHHITDKFILGVTCKEVDSLTDKLQKEFEQLNKSKKILLIHMGVGPNTVYHLEDCAYNNKDFRIPDNDNYQPRKEHICHNLQLDEPIKTKLDLTKIHAHLESKHSMNVSKDPGRYLCNYIYFCSMNKLGCNSNVTCFFLHIPTSQHTTKQQNRAFLFDFIDSVQKLDCHR